MLYETGPIESHLDSSYYNAGSYLFEGSNTGRTIKNTKGKVMSYERFSPSYLAPFSLFTTEK